MKKTILKLTAATAGALHCINKYIDNTVENSTVKSSGRYYHWRNGDIFYRVMGEGEPILLLHDLNVFSSESDWNQVLRNLTSTNKVYVPDFIGCGRSDKPSITYTGYFYVQMITDFVKNIIQEKTVVAASGISAAYVLMADSLDNHLFQKIMLINPPTLSSLKKMPDDHSRMLTKLFHFPIVGKTCYYIAVNKTNAEDYFSEKCFYNPFCLKQQTIKAGYQAAHYGSGNGRYLFASQQGGYLNTDPTEALRKTNQELVLILSEHAPGAKEIAESYQKINDSLKLITIKDTKKLPELEAPERISEAIKIFL